MKIKEISKIISFALAIIIIGFAVSVSWSLNHLNRSFAAVEFFGAEKDKLFTQVSQPILNYLFTGEATLLANIERSLTSIKTEVAEQSKLPLPMQAPFVAILDELQNSTLAELTAAGKLADPQVLLLNSEQQIFKHLQTLLAYAQAANQASQTDKLRYFTMLSRSQAALMNLAKSRQNFLSTRKAITTQSVDFALQELTASAVELKALPLLGLMTSVNTDQDIFSLGEKSNEQVSEDKAIAPINEITALLQRYPKELHNAELLTKAKLDGQAKINQQIIHLQQQLLDLEQQITREYQFYQRLLYLIMPICGLLIITCSVFMIGLKLHLANLISQISDYINKLALGNLSASFTTQSRISEVKQLETALNKLHDYFNLLFHNINQQSATLCNSGEDILQVAQNLESIIAEQQKATVDAASQMQQLTDSFKEVANNAVESQTATNSAKQLVNLSADQMADTSQIVNGLAQTMEDTATALTSLQSDVASIEGVLEGIQSFTDQTNLLALNAAIEAARAGNHGRGFAVVADEVRKLATDTATSAKQIQSLLDKLNTATSTTVKLMNNQQLAVKNTDQAVQQINLTFQGIKNSIQHISEKSIMIASAASEQSQCTESIAYNFSQTAELAKQTTQEAQNNKANASALSQISENLRELVARFKFA